MAKRFEVILFDLGGVLIELSGVAVMIDWLGGSVTLESLWQRWLASPTVRRFETGRLQQRDFAEQLIEEMSLPVEPDEFIADFTIWPRGLFPGARELIQAIPAAYKLAVLSNSNPIHWPRMLDEIGSAGRFHYCFASHLLGKIKPDIEIFEHVLTELGYPAEQILYFDDNRVNVEAAHSLGIQAEETKGIADVRQVLTDYGIIESTA